MLNLQQDTNRREKCWVRIADLPFSRQHFYNHFRHNPEIIVSEMKSPGSTKGIVLVDADSLDAYLTKQAKEAK